MKNRFLSLALALAFCMGLALPSFAADSALIGRPAPIGAGNVHAYIDTNHTLWTFGSNYAGALGNGKQSPSMTSPPEMTPTKVLDNVYSVSIGFHTTYAIKKDGSLWVWVENNNGELGFKGGNDSNAAYAYPVPIQTVPYKLMDNVAAVCHDVDASAAIKKDGSLWIWGWYLLDDEEYKPRKLTNNVIAASVDGGRLAYVTADHALWIKEQIDPPKRVMSDVIDTAIGYNFVFAIKSDHSLWAWGKNELGQLGIGSTKPSDTPVKIMDGVRQISIGDRDIAAVKLDNSLWVWGDNDEYRLGTKKTDLKSSGVIDPYRIVWTPTKIMDDVAYANMQPLTVTKTDGSYWSNYLQEDGKLVQLPNITVGLDSSSTGSPTTPDIPTVGGFSDVKENNYFAEPVKWAVSKGITTGTSGTKFSPEEKCTHIQILTFLYRAVEQIKAPNAVDTERAVIWAQEKGMLAADFNRSKPCTRAEAVYYIWQALGRQDAPASSFTDVPAGASYSKAVDWAVVNEVTNGTSATTFSPNDTCTRGQIVTFLYRAMG